MRVKVSLFAHLKRYSPKGDGNFYLELAPGTTVENIVNILGIPPGIQRVILVNGRQVDMSVAVRHSDLVTFLVPASGG